MSDAEVKLHVYTEFDLVYKHNVSRACKIIKHFNYFVFFVICENSPFNDLFMFKN